MPAKKRKKLNHYPRENRKNKNILSRELGMDVVPPPEVIAERMARVLTPRTLAMQLFGDPPPGYSALDRR